MSNTRWHLISWNVGGRSMPSCMISNAIRTLAISFCMVSCHTVFPFYHQCGDNCHKSWKFRSQACEFVWNIACSRPLWSGVPRSSSSGSLTKSSYLNESPRALSNDLLNLSRSCLWASSTRSSFVRPRTVEQYVIAGHMSMTGPRSRPSTILSSRYVIAVSRNISHPFKPTK